MQHRPTRTVRTTEALVEDWVISVYREVIRVVSRRPGHEPEEIAGEVADELYAKGAAGLAAHVAANPDPEKWARQRANHARIQHDRDERVQRCQGTRLVRLADGTLRPQRSIVWGNAPVHGDDGAELGERFDTLALHQDSFEQGLVDGLDAHDRVCRYAKGVGARELEELFLIHADGYSVTEVADRRGQQRETLSRRTSAARRTMRQNAGEQCTASGEEDLA